jgi:DnaJ-class molecular chaperone
MHYEDLKWAKDTLGLLSKSTYSDLKREYKILSKKYHPDLGGDTQKFQEINKAYVILKEYMENFRYVLDEEEYKKQHPSLQNEAWIAKE